MGEFPSGQRGQTVNLLALPSMVRIHPPPPTLEHLDSQGFQRFYCSSHRKMERLKTTKKAQNKTIILLLDCCQKGPSGLGSVLGPPFSGRLFLFSPLRMDKAVLGEVAGHVAKSKTFPQGNESIHHAGTSFTRFGFLLYMQPPPRCMAPLFPPLAFHWSTFLQNIYFTLAFFPSPNIEHLFYIHG